MKLSYHKYYLKHGSDRHQYNLLPLLEKFVAVDSKALKNSFFSHGANLFLFQLSVQMFLFIVTKDNEIIKSIDSDNYSFQDIHEKLSVNENIGFASYIYFADNYYGIASTFYGPKNIIFNNFVNDILKKLSLDSYCFESTPFPIEATRDTVLNLEFKSSVRFDLSSENPFFDEILGFFGRPKDTDTIAIKFKPKPRGQMEETFDSIMEKLEDDGVKNFIAKGKETMQDSLTDFYITGAGHVCDFIKVKGEMEICTAIKEKIGRNTLLANGIKEFKDDKNYIQTNIQDLSHFNNLDHWNNYLQHSPYAG